MLREEVVEYERDRQRLEGAENRLARLEREVRQSLERQGAAREEHERRHKALSSYFDWTLKKLLGRDAGGAVLLDARGLHPDPGPSVAASGAAIATLSTVLGLDLACLTASICGLGHLPCFLMHDSPKEADMGDSKGRKECAPNPAKSARARIPLKWLWAIARAERNANRPKRAMATGC